MSAGRKTVLITGCSDGGIGQTLAEEFAKTCHVYATARSVSKMSALQSVTHITLLQLDVCSKDSIVACRDRIDAETGGKLDVLVNNAGISYTTASVEMDVEVCREVFEANVFAVMEMNKQFTKLLVAAKGTILSTGSIAGIMPNPFGGVYHTSKAALHMYLDCLRIELEPFGVNVVTAVTGGVQSNIAQNGATRFKIAEDSLYKPIEADMRSRLNASQDAGTCSRGVYAKAVVSQTLRTSPPPRIWMGKFSTLIWILNSFAPYWVMARIMSKRFGMDKLKAMVNRG
ncbi:Putative uncharacterized protein [Taphrina deformans PYCC 5710]|uniref:Uncharacterized protein n=1 Tax=Taphrina deformans (strain PYCC 5710 / ATCC 11124 / CBS 356.35 / IMI 108563 / JCM 9778 / NBRC 8474) TaxID=1097556 RepID=R4XA95_TAPDE|nr:Putative uncharacterized protein [Taphrina deformans PYCC 5710]|eukprot:CCG81194.1 Putative uncharacterized protein [Taphrina deformans PYCC 5710]